MAGGGTRGTRKGKRPKEQHEISDSAVDVRFLLLGRGFVLIVGRLCHQSARRSGRVGNLRRKLCDEWWRGRERNDHQRRAPGNRRRFGNGRRCDRWVNVGTRRLCGWRVSAWYQRLSDRRNDCRTGRLFHRWVDCGNRRPSHWRVGARHGRSQWNGGWQWRSQREWRS
jgi:hypothetical protein